MKSILVADDQPDERSIQRTLLEHLGYQVEEAADGEEALERIRGRRPDLVVLDMAMPRLDGLAVCRALRADPATSKLPVLFYTASVAEEWQEEVEQLGACGVLMKPADPHDLAQQIERLIGRPD